MKSHWVTKTFADAPIEIIDGDRGKNYPNQMELSNTGFCLFLNAGNVTKRGFVFENCQFISEQKDNLLRKGKLTRYDVVMTTRGTIGNIAYYSERIPYDNIRINSGMVIFRCNSNFISPLFLYQYLSSPQFYKQVNALRSGVAQPQLPIRDIRRIEIPIPSFAEQIRICRVISAYDDLIENNRRRIQLLEQSIHLLYMEWFVHFRFPGHEHVKIVDGVPEGWEQLSVPDIIEINPSESVQKNSDIRYVPMSSLSESGMTVDMSDTEIRQKATSVKFRNGDTLLARITPCLENGKTGFVNFLNENEVACGSTEFIVLRGRKVSPYFVYCLARTHNFRGKAIKSMIGSSGRQRVQKSCFDDFVLGLSPKQLLLQFDDVASNCFKQISNLMRQNEQLHKAHDLLLPRIINGEIAV